MVEGQPFQVGRDLGCENSGPEVGNRVIGGQPHRQTPLALLLHLDAGVPTWKGKQALIRLIHR